MRGKEKARSNGEKDMKWIGKKQIKSQSKDKSERTARGQEQEEGTSEAIIKQDKTETEKTGEMESGS